MRKLWVLLLTLLGVFGLDFAGCGASTLVINSSGTYNLSSVIEYVIINASDVVLDCGSSSGPNVIYAGINSIGNYDNIIIQNCLISGSYDEGGGHGIVMRGTNIQVLNSDIGGSQYICPPYNYSCPHEDRGANLNIYNSIGVTLTNVSLMDDIDTCGTADLNQLNLSGVSDVQILNTTLCDGASSGVNTLTNITSANLTQLKAGCSANWNIYSSSSVNITDASAYVSMNSTDSINVYGTNSGLALINVDGETLSSFKAFSVVLTNSSSNSFTNVTVNKTSGASAAFTLSSNSNNNVFSQNTVQATKWFDNSGSGNIYNNSTTGNKYYFLNGSGAWTTYSIFDINSDGYADIGESLPFNSTTTSSNWVGNGQDGHPYTLNTAPTSNLSVVILSPTENQYIVTDTLSFDYIYNISGGTNVRNCYLSIMQQGTGFFQVSKYVDCNATDSIAEVTAYGTYTAYVGAYDDSGAQWDTVTYRFVRPEAGGGATALDQCALQGIGCAYDCIPGFNCAKDKLDCIPMLNCPIKPGEKDKCYPSKQLKITCGLCTPGIDCPWDIICLKYPKTPGCEIVINPFLMGTFPWLASLAASLRIAIFNTLILIKKIWWILSIVLLVVAYNDMRKGKDTVVGIGAFALAVIIVLVFV